MATEYLRHCNNCGLTYRPDERIYKDANEKCPRCGHMLVPGQEDTDDEQSDRST